MNVGLKCESGFTLEYFGRKQISARQALTDGAVKLQAINQVRLILNAAHPALHSGPG